MTERIYVGNLPFKTTDDELKSLFNPFGEVKSAEVIRYRKTNRSKGYGFVEMPKEEALKAIEGLNEKVFNEREIVVKLAEERTNFPGDSVSANLKNIHIGID
ncbi:MAG: RNA-binding protein [Deltaproteobacteria bacterium]|nr:RNA-binding protein [Deltaproteobacteria bacterium]